MANFSSLLSSNAARQLGKIVKTPVSQLSRAQKATAIASGLGLGAGLGTATGQHILEALMGAPVGAITHTSPELLLAKANLNARNAAIEHLQNAAKHTRSLASTLKYVGAGKSDLHPLLSNSPKFQEAVGSSVKSVTEAMSREKERALASIGSKFRTTLKAPTNHNLRELLEKGILDDLGSAGVSDNALLMESLKYPDSAPASTGRFVRQMLNINPPASASEIKQIVRELGSTYDSSLLRGTNTLRRALMHGPADSYFRANNLSSIRDAASTLSKADFKQKLIESLPRNFTPKDQVGQINSKIRQMLDYDSMGVSRLGDQGNRLQEAIAANLRLRSFDPSSSLFPNMLPKLQSADKKLTKVLGEFEELRQRVGGKLSKDEATLLQLKRDLAQHRHRYIPAGPGRMYVREFGYETPRRLVKYIDGERYKLVPDTIAPIKDKIRALELTGTKMPPYQDMDKYKAFQSKTLLNAIQKIYGK